MDVIKEKHTTMFDHHSETEILVPRMKDRAYEKFMARNGGIVDNATDMMSEFLSGLSIPGYDIKIDHDKLARMLRNYIYTHS